MSIQKHSLYYMTIIIQFTVLIYYIFFNDNIKRSSLEYPDGNLNLKYNIEFGKKLDSILLERKKQNKLAEEYYNCNRKEVEVQTRQSNVYKTTDNQFYTIDTVKVSYVGKDGVTVVKKYPLHKTIVD